MMQVRYNRLFAAFIIIPALINVVLGVWLLLLGEFSFTIIIGFSFLFMGFLFLNRPYFTVDKSKVTVPALLGPVKREFYFGSPENIRWSNNKLEVKEGVGWKRVPVRRWQSRHEDWQAFEALVS
jgi:hypothetical protein